MEDYAKDGFEVQMFEEDGQYLVYSRRVATVQASRIMARASVQPAASRLKLTADCRQLNLKEG